MFHVLDHADVVYTGDLSQTTQYIIDHYGRKLDDAIRAGIRILYTDPLHGLSEAREALLGDRAPEFWEPAEDWMLD